MQFSKEEYLIIFMAFIYGYVAQEFFQGWGKILRKSGFRNINLYYLLWTFLTFGLLIDFWWGFWDRNMAISKNIGYFVQSLIPPLIFYLISVSLFPKKIGQKDFSVSEYFASKIASVLWLLAALFLSDLIITLSTRPDKLEDIAFLGFAIALSVIAALFPTKWFHRVIFTMGWLLLILHFFIEM